MRGLLVKDLRLLLQQKKIFIIMLFVAVMLNFNSDGVFIIGYVTFMCSNFGLSTISYDEFDNGYSFLFTLPVGRKTYVKEKYVFSIILGVVAWLLGVILSVPFQMYKNVDFVLADALLEVCILLPCLFVLLAIMLPFQLKFGGEKGRMAMLIGVGIVLVVGCALVKLVEWLHIDVEGFFNSLPVLDIRLLVAVVLVVLLIAMFFSYWVSEKIMENKEF